MNSQSNSNYIFKIMWKFYKKDKSEIEAIIKKVAEKKHIHPSYVEKDFWISLTLNYLFTKFKYKNYIVFKGGTCLSKCYKSITRFSEDVDLVLDWDLLHFDKTSMEGKSFNVKESISHRLDRDNNQFVQNVILPTIKQELNELLGLGNDLKIEGDDKNCIFIYYPKLFTDQYLLPAIKLEINAKAAWKPSTKRKVSTFITEQYPTLLNDASFDVICSSADQIFWDKVTILHRESHRKDNEKIPLRYARHYYDLFCLANNKKIKDIAMKNRNVMKQAVDFKLLYYRQPWAKYEDILDKKIQLIPKNVHIKDVEIDYNNMKSMLYGNVPSFDEIVKFLKKLQNELNS